MKNLLIISILASFLFTSCEKPFEYNVSDIPKDFVPLAKPAAGKGYQMHVPPFPVPANFEREWYMRMPIGNTEKIYVTSMEVKMRDGSHHMIAYPFQNENDPKNPAIGVIRDQNLPSGSLNFRSNLNMNGFVLESTAPEYRIDIPAGYAIPFAGGATLDMNAHYFNKTGKTLFGEVYMNLNTKPKSEIKGELNYLIGDNHDKLTLPPNKKTIVTDTLVFDTLTQIMILTSHNHKRGERFEIYGVGGEHNGKLIYTSTDYIHPPILYFEKPLTFKKGEGLKYVVTYNNNTNRTINFGVTSEDEMGIVYGYFIK
jgi:hypothetical protein